MKNRGKIIRVTTVPRSLGGLLQGQLKFMSQYYDVIGVSSREENILERVAKQEEINVIPVEMTRKITPIQDLKAVYQLYKVFKKEKPDIVHSHTPKAGTLSMLAAKIAGVPHRLHTIAGLPLLEATGAKRVLLDTVEKLTYACATMIYPNSFGLNDIILENKYTSAKKLKVIANGSSNGIDTSHFDPSQYSDADNTKLREELKIDENDFVFVFVGRFVKDKGVNELITSFKKLNDEHKNTKLLLVGTYERELDPLLPETENEIDNNPNIISVGWQHDVRPFFAISNALTFPSYREGFPNVVMQSGSMGLPSIVTDINGCNEIVSEEVNGVIIPVKSSEALYDAMKKFISDKAYCHQLSLKSREMICEKYERKYVWNAILEEYSQL
ncbi:glycosyltransferase family 4 protein [uncultured Aquimarina sp.]|uniref:glycosyltransferase family 4 protein n=1 Tax=uncultured Aquimarina sp. TaxID=575652 RepID=UPI002619B4C3|nr:glycosyltransferase family 4 protein [uncultured Aquimarina sp.]